MADSDNTTASPGAKTRLTRRALLAISAALPAVAALPVIGAGAGLPDDTRLAELISRYQEIETFLDEFDDEPRESLPSKLWTPEEPLRPGGGDCYDADEE